jgi:hypothetical protein
MATAAIVPRRRSAHHAPKGNTRSGRSAIWTLIVANGIQQYQPNYQRG